MYRYVASRDELLTRLIVAAYDALGSAAEAQEAAVARADLAGRWAAVCGAVRGWALANPNEYSLIYGTPVPGYIAPPATIAPAARVSSVLLGILADAAERLPPAIAEDDVPPDARKALAPPRSVVPPEVPDALLHRGLMAWAALFGTVSFELFGQLHGIVGDQPGDREAFFAESVRRWAAHVGIAPGRTGPGARKPRASWSPPGRRQPSCPGHRHQHQPHCERSEFMTSAFREKRALCRACVPG